MDKSLLKLPYKLIEFYDNGEQFTLSFGSFDSTQSERSVMRGGLSGGFEAAYSCEGIHLKKQQHKRKEDINAT